MTTGREKSQHPHCGTKWMLMARHPEAQEQVRPFGPADVVPECSPTSHAAQQTMQIQ